MGIEELDSDDERAEELNTLCSIYPELDLGAGNAYTAILDLRVAPAKPLAVTFEPEDAVERLSYLPSLHLEINLPATYPAETPPSILITSSPPWLPPNVAQKLQGAASLLWEEYGRCSMLFSYISSLQEQAELAFDLDGLTLPSHMRKELIDYSKKMKRELFDNETFDCEVCLEPKKGAVCYCMERCNHVFCITCLQDYYNNCIREGHVNNVKCMSTDCGKSGGSRKKDRLLSPKELLQIPISRKNVERYANMKRKKKIESDPAITFCPRTWCQGAMRTEKYPKIVDVTQIDESDSEADKTELPEQEHATNPKGGVERRAIGVRGMERLAICEDCTLAFCTVCLASWHGDFVRCEPRDKDALTEEDQASLNFILKSTSPCPYCSVPCEKSFGCNHMTCAQCQTHFCYLCGAWLNPDHPYAHFNDPKQKLCFQRLMDGAEGNEINVQFGGRRGAEQIAEFWEQEAMRIQAQINEEATQ